MTTLAKVFSISRWTSEYSHTWLYQGDGWTISIDKMDRRAMNWTLFDILSSIHQGANCSTFMKIGFISKIIEKVLTQTSAQLCYETRTAILCSNTSRLMQMWVDCKHWVNSKKAKFGIRQPNFKDIILTLFLAWKWLCLQYVQFFYQIVSGNITLVTFNFWRRKKQ